MGVQNAAVKQF